MYKLTAYTKILFIIFLITGCEETETNADYGCDGTWVSSNKISGEWELYKQEYTNLHWDNWNEADTIFNRSFNYELNLGTDPIYTFEILWDYNEFNWYFFGSWNLLDNCGTLEWNFIEFPDTYIDEFYVMPHIIKCEIHPSIYPNPDTLYIFWEKNFIDKYYGINYLTKK